MADFWQQENVLIFGAGFSGRAFARLALAAGATVTGTTRSAEKGEALAADGITPLVFDGSITFDVEAALAQASIIVMSIAPGETGDPVLSELSGALAASPAHWMAYLSTVGVYGNHDGAWVDEDTAPKPVSTRSIQRVAAEAQWRELADQARKPLAILRLSGIYGPGRNGLVNLDMGTARRLVKPGQVFNRIHVHDIARALIFLGARQADGIFNVTDDLPAPPQDVVEYAATLMQCDVPPPIDFETATLSPMARSFYGENKRVSNAKIKEMGFAFDYPDYRTAFLRMWNEDTWRG
ncbi:MAG: SDR family oxidoreductase [Pseudomonadota bacterium]